MLGSSLIHLRIGTAAAASIGQFKCQWVNSHNICLMLQGENVIHNIIYFWLCLAKFADKFCSLYPKVWITFHVSVLHMYLRQDMKMADNLVYCTEEQLSTAKRN